MVKIPTANHCSNSAAYPEEPLVRGNSCRKGPKHWGPCQPHGLHTATHHLTRTKFFPLGREHSKISTHWGFEFAIYKLEFMNLNELHLQLRLYLLFCYFYTHTHTHRLFCYIWYNSFLWHDENFYPEKHFFIIKSVNTKKDLFLQKIMTNALIFARLSIIWLKSILSIINSRNKTWHITTDNSKHQKDNEGILPKFYAHKFDPTGEMEQYLKNAN